MVTPKVFDHSGTEVKLGRRLGVGGEGAVFEVMGQAEHVAKLYHRPPLAERADKLRFMAANGSPELVKFSAWPVTTLHHHPNGPVLGFVMPRFTGKEIHVLYGVRHRLKEFPEADWRFLAYAALNCAITFDAVHRHGLVIADVNQKNVLVSRKATVGLLDCDSFQMAAHGKLFRCEVGVAEYTPPELQNTPFRGVIRTPNHDLFGLAVHLFHLLFMGRHPFMGRFLGGDKALEDAIRECRFVYGQGAATKQMQPPPHSLPISLVPPLIGGLFERAFAERAMTGGRPTAAEWHGALQAMVQQLKICPADKGHSFSSHLGSCPWCLVIDKGGPLYFVTVQIGGLQFICGAPQLAAVWGEVERVVSVASLALDVPAVASAAQLLPTPLSQPIIRARRRHRFAKAAAMASVTVLFLALAFLVKPWARAALPALPQPMPALSTSDVLRDRYARELAAFEATLRAEPSDHRPLAFAALAALTGLTSSAAWGYEAWRSVYGVERRRRRKAVRSSGAALKEGTNAWHQMTEDYRRRFKELRSKVEDLRGQHLGLQPAFDAEMKKLESAREQMQLCEYLDDQYIQIAKIPKIGDGRKAILRGYGIETALDVLEKQAVDIPGFGPTLRSALLAWVQDVRMAFRFDPQKNVPEKERRGRVLEYRRRQLHIEGQIRQIASELGEVSVATERRACELSGAIDRLTKQLLQAQADWSVVES